jgi:hypothetical protein
MLDQLRRLVHLDVDSEHRDPHREPPEVVEQADTTASA